MAAPAAGPHHSASIKHALKVFTHFFDADGDGHQDFHDAALVGYWLWWCVELFFDCTVSVIPIGGLVGTAMSSVGTYIIARSGKQCLDALADLQKVRLGPYQKYIFIVLGLILAADLAAICNGFACGIQRAIRRVDRAKEEKVCGCGPDQVERRGKCAERCCCGLRLLGSGVQSLYNILGAITLWVSIIVAYMWSVAFLLLYGGMMLMNMWGDSVIEYLEMGIDFAETTIETSEELLGLQEDMASGSMTEDQSMHDAGVPTNDVLMYRMSPVQAAMDVMEDSPLSPDLVESMQQLLVDSENFKEFVEEVNGTFEPMPRLLLRCMVGAGLLLIGQIVMLVFHSNYATIWYYETAMRRRRYDLAIEELDEADAKKQAAEDSDTSTDGANAKTPKADGLPSKGMRVSRGHRRSSSKDMKERL